MLAPDVSEIEFCFTGCGKIHKALTSPSHCPHCQVAAPDYGFPTAQAVKLAEQNDRFRAGLLNGKATDLRGTVVTTAAVAAFGRDFTTDAYMAVARDTVFTADNDPHGDHVFGTVTVQGTKLFWKIDLYDLQLEYGSPDPADPAVTHRVLTIMLPSDW